MPELRGADGLLARAHKWLAPERGNTCEWHEQTRTWTFESGAILEFGHVETDTDRFKYDGRAYQFVGFDELTSFTPTQYDHIGFTRTSPQVAVDVPLRTRGSCTPTGTGYGWVKRRFITHREDDVLFVPAKVRDNPGVRAEDYELSLQRVPEELRKRLLEGDWDVFEGAAFPDFGADHVVAPFAIPAEWDRFECMDFGVSNPTAWYVVATDYDGNLIVFDGVYGPNRDTTGRPTGGLPSETAPLILAKRAAGWEQRDQDGWKTQTNRVWADPSTRNTEGIGDRLGMRTSVMQEFTDLGVGGLVPANNDRVAGYLRLAELIRLDAGRRFPAWHPKAGAPNAPRLYVFSTNAELVEQLQAAPLEVEGKLHAGEALAGEWESQQGHAAAALRYGGLSRPSASKEPVPEIADPRDAMLARRQARREDGSFWADRGDDQFEDF